MKQIQCPESHTDTYIIPKDELEELKNNGMISKDIDGLLGCNGCEDFYELTEPK